jgi:ethanolamine utilization protein EutN
MLKGRVLGSIWATRKVDQLPPGAFLEIEIDGGSTLVAFDVLGSGVGERVLIATGSVASGWFGDSHPPIDALIIGSIDDQAAAPAAPRTDTGVI